MLCYYLPFLLSWYVGVNTDQMGKSLLKHPDTDAVTFSYTVEGRELSKET